MIRAHALTKKFGDRVAVDGIDFVVEPGRVTGFLGPNGAGKSTTMRMIARPRRARRPARSASTATGTPRPRRRCARSAPSSTRTPSTPGGPPATTCAGWRRPTASRPPASARCSSWSASSRSPASGPAGSRSAWASGSASPRRMLGDPPVVVLDEPVNGLDPEGIRWVRTFARQLADEGRTVFISSHLMSRDGADGRPPDRDRPRPDPRRLLDERLHGRPRRVVRPGQGARARPTPRRCSPAAASTSQRVDGELRVAGPRRPGRRRAARSAPAWRCTS